MVTNRVTKLSLCLVITKFGDKFVTEFVTKFVTKIVWAPIWVRLAAFSQFLASPDALEVIVVPYSLTYSLTPLLSVSTDLTDVTLVSDDTY